MSCQNHKNDAFASISKHYITKGVAELLPMDLILMMLILIDSMDAEERDYLQIFKLRNMKEYVEIIHEQEVPEYTDTVKYFCDEVQFDKLRIFVIAEEDFCTVLLSTEY